MVLTLKFFGIFLFLIETLKLKHTSKKSKFLIKCCSSLISFFDEQLHVNLNKTWIGLLSISLLKLKWKTPLIVVAKCTFHSHWIACFTCSPSNALFGISRAPNVTCYHKEWLRGSLHIWLIKAVHFIVTRQRARTSRTFHEWYVRGLQH